VLLLLVVLLQAVRLGRLKRRLDDLTRGEDGLSLAGVLEAHLDRVHTLAGQVDELGVRTAVAEANLRRSVQRFAIVRFNPFEDTGGNQSFALALLDANGDGLVLTSLHSRAGTRVYAKAVTGGRSEAALSDEESRAVREALAAPPARSPSTV
jgi:hypothetical protein